jgi:hypothetical protein
VKCPECTKRIPQSDLPDRAIHYRGGWMHRTCYLRASGQYDLMEKLFQMQDEPDIDPETALADLVGNLAQFAKIKKIDFARALHRGAAYAEVEV